MLRGAVWPVEKLTCRYSHKSASSGAIPTLHGFISLQEFVLQCAEQEYGLKTMHTALPE